MDRSYTLDPYIFLLFCLLELLRFLFLLSASKTTPRSSFLLSLSIFPGPYLIPLGCSPLDYQAYPYSLSPYSSRVILFRLDPPVRSFLSISFSSGTTYIVFAVYQLSPSSISISPLTTYLRRLLLQTSV